MNDLVTSMFAVWAATVVLLVAIAFISSLQFVSAHSRRRGEFMSDSERLDLALKSPRSYLRRAISDANAREAALFRTSDDDDIERPRKRTLRFAAAALAVGFLGLPITFTAVGLARRALPALADWSIPGFWLVLLAIAYRRRASRVALGLILLAAAASVIATLWLRTRG